ncbi:putative T7SS-secreted protein [Kitasatospora sp. MAA4]|uniref:putative T7SS-secreted protein n=1 Tax=Kitasatospora sp. MAA4 TaxID=3035093 RepID=UPI0024733A52|nr:hypothetical protein [Kitasatospora sp. MAA4]
MTDLGKTNDPKALVPGDPATISHTQASLQAYGDLLHLAGAGLQRIDTSDGWSGDAADAFRKVFHGQPTKWLQAGDAFHDAAGALNTYVSVLSWAQGQATDAINLWNSGDASHQAAQEKLDSARSQLDSAGKAAATVVGKARDLAPPKPGFWHDVGSFFSDAGHVAVQVGETAATDLASVGNAMLHDPGSTLSVAGGLGLAVLGAGGEVGGVALDITGVGAALGVPLAAVSAAAITGGLGMAGVGMTNVLHDAAGSDRVNMNSDGGGSGGSGTGGDPAPRSYQSNPGSIGQDLGYSRRQINDAIHAVKGQGGWRGIGGNKNPDVVVDTSTGEVYPKLPDGSPADDSIGNIFDYLPED